MTAGHWPKDARLPVPTLFAFELQFLDHLTRWVTRNSLQLYGPTPARTPERSQLPKTERPSKSSRIDFAMLSSMMPMRCLQPFLPSMVLGSGSFTQATFMSAAIASLRCRKTNSRIQSNSTHAATLNGATFVMKSSNEYKRTLNTKTSCPISTNFHRRESFIPTQSFPAACS
jgi:hypothetical protein